MKSVSKNVVHHLTSDELLDLNLINKEIVGSLIGILAYIILIFSAIASRDVILQGDRTAAASSKHTNSAADSPPINRSELNNTTSSNTTSPADIAAISGWISLVASIILGVISFTRLNQREKEIETGTNRIPLYAIINISAGYAIVILGAFIRAIGDQQGADLGGPIAIR